MNTYKIQQVCVQLLGLFTLCKQTIRVGSHICLKLWPFFLCCSGVLCGSCYFKETPAGLTTGCQHLLTVICSLAGCESSPACGKITHYWEECLAVLGRGVLETYLTGLIVSGFIFLGYALGIISLDWICCENEKAQSYLPAGRRKSNLFL